VGERKREEGIVVIVDSSGVKVDGGEKKGRARNWKGRGKRDRVRQRILNDGNRGLG